MSKFIELIKQRRVWAGVVGVTAFVLSVIRVDFQVDVDLLTNLLSELGSGIAALISALLALHSYVNPKKK